MKTENIISLFFPEEGFEWHNEDSAAISRRFPIAAVGDGVTLPPYEELVMPSGAKLAADIFTQKSVSYLERHYDHFTSHAITEAYSIANQGIQKLNRTHQKKTDLRRERKEAPFAAVGALAAVRDGIVYGSRITDCGLVLIRNQRMVFKTPEFWRTLASRMARTQLKRLSKKRTAERKKPRAINDPKEINSYGVLNGDPRALPFIEYWSFPYKKGDCLVLFTDGFEHHFSRQEFRRCFSHASIGKLVHSLKKTDAALASINHERYGHERTIVIAQFS